jgi:uncharacterized damage-inducible protein DinB
MTSLQSIPSVIEALRRAPDVIIPLVREAPPGILRRRPASGKWSIHEHACHLAAVPPLFSDRLKAMLAEAHPVITPYDPGTNDNPDALLAINLEEALDRFRRERSHLVDRLRSLRPEDWQRTAEHAEYSHYSVFIMFRHLALHDFFHSYRIEELLLSRQWNQ